MIGTAWSLLPPIVAIALALNLIKSYRVGWCEADVST